MHVHQPWTAVEYTILFLVSMNMVNSSFIYSLQYEDLGELCADSRAKAAVLAEMDAVGKEAQVTPYLLPRIS